MAIEQVDESAVRQALDRVLSSAGFSKSERLSRFLRFVVERHLEGRDGELKESRAAVAALLLAEPPSTPRNLPEPPRTPQNLQSTCR
jgi:hypothetical protein